MLISAAIGSISRFLRLLKAGDDSRLVVTQIANDTARIEVPALYPGDHQTSAKIGMHERQGSKGQDVFLGLDQSFKDTAYWAAPFHCSRDLGNFETR